MSIEDRNCNCMNDNNMTSNNNIIINNNMMSNNNTMCDTNCPNTREEMLKQIKAYRFAIIELALYLDTHVSDTKAICLHNKYCKELKELSDKYQKVYGPLTIEYPCNKWRWIEEPWASFIFGYLKAHSLLKSSRDIKFIFNFYIFIINYYFINELKYKAFVLII